MNSRSLKQRTRPGYGASPYRGVAWNSQQSKWVGCIKLSGGNKHLGYFNDELEALSAVNTAYAEIFPDYPELQQQPIQQSSLQSILTQRWAGGDYE